MRPLLPSLKEKKRYLVFEILGEKKLTFGAISKEIEESLLKFIGDLGVARAGVQFLPEKWSQAKQRGIIRVNHRYINHLKAALALVHIPKTIVKSVGVSGILKKAQTKYLAS